MNLTFHASLPATSTGFLQRASSSCASLFERAKSKSSAIAFAVMGGITAAVIGYSLYSHFQTKPSKVPEMVDSCNQCIQENRFVEARTLIQTFSKQFVENAFDSVSAHQKSQDFLSTRLSDFLLNTTVATESQKQIVEGILNDFVDHINETTKRVREDAREGRLESLGIEPKTALKEVRCLGKESHNGGRLPMLLIFEGGVKVVYKPRSLLPEQVLCGKEESVFAAAGLGTYTVLLREDENGEYGYCEYLYNREEENTLNSLEEVEAYYEQLCTVEKIFKKLGYSDLHFENVVTDQTKIKVIDGEAYLGPKGTNTGFFDIATGAGTAFTLGEGGIGVPVGKNRVWIDASLTDEHGVSFENELSEKRLKKIGVQVEMIQKTVGSAPFSEEVKTSLAQAKERLSQAPGRYILIDTQALCHLLAVGDLNNAESLNGFIEAIRYCSGEKGFEFVEKSTPQILENYKQDLLHHDFPIFYYDSVHKTVLYHGIVVASSLS